MKSDAIKVAIIDLYNNDPNQGMRCIKELVGQCDKKKSGQAVAYNIFETRYKEEVPELEYDIYISSGGPGSPFDGEGTVWEKRYFELIEKIWNYNRQNPARKKYVFFICHSFQLMCRIFKLAAVQERSKRSFGVVPVHKTGAADTDFLLRDLPKPYFAADFRNFEVVKPDQDRLIELGATVLSIEHERKDPRFERALMAIRLSDEFVGTQYHPEADPVSMLYHLRQPEGKQQVVEEYGEEKYHEMIAHLEDPNNITLTRKMVLPRFLMDAIHKIRRASGKNGGFSHEDEDIFYPEKAIPGNKLVDSAE
jgi:GMP synthase-like glutamine amidotransferase